MRRLTALPLLALGLAACDGEDTIVYCALPSASVAPLAPSGPSRLSVVAPAAVLVSVQDSASGADLGPQATGAFVVGSYADSLRHGWDGPLVAWGPAGRYAIVVQHDGYATWGTDDVRVQAGNCGPQTVRITARLQRLGG